MSGTVSAEAQLIRDALLRYHGNGRQSFPRGRETGPLPAVVSSAYDKLSRLPLTVSEAFLAESTDRLRQVLPPRHDHPVPESLRAFAVVVIDGKAIKRVAKRLKPLRDRKGGVLGGKALVALHLESGLVVAAATHSDGEARTYVRVPHSPRRTPQENGLCTSIMIRTAVDESPPLALLFVNSTELCSARLRGCGTS